MFLLTKYEEYASNHPSLQGVQSIGLWRVGSDGIENVDENKKQGDMQSHSALKYEITNCFLDGHQKWRYVILLSESPTKEHESDTSDSIYDTESF